MDTNQLEPIIKLLNPWRTGQKINLGIPRLTYLKQIDTSVSNRKQILFILGSRRVGKTMLIFQYIYQLIKTGTNPQKILFLSLDNTNLQNLDLFTYLTTAKFDYIFLDEIHSFPNWAQILKSLYDLPFFSAKIICSGSSSKLIEDSKAYLTGRNTCLNIYPLSFIEFKKFNSSSNDHLTDYLHYGGYPEYVLEKQPNYLDDLVRDIITKDIVKLHKLKNSQYLFNICQILARQIGFKGSANKISKVLGLDNKTVSNYIGYLQEVRLISTISQFSPSLNQQLYSAKKYYFNDLGVRNNFVGFSDIGSLVENAVFIRLNQLFDINQIYYFHSSNSHEIDFVVTLQSNQIILIESKYIDLEESIINSLSNSFFSSFKPKKVTHRLVVTNNLNKHLDINDCPVELISLENFLTKDNHF